MSVTKEGQSGRFTPHTTPPRYSVALLSSVSPWLLQNISLANIILTQKFPVALTKVPVLTVFLAKQYCVQTESTSREKCWFV